MSKVLVTLGLTVAVLMQHYYAAAQTVHVVGDGSGWTVPPTGVAFYQTWAANKKFVVGDILSESSHFLCFFSFFKKNKKFIGICN